MVIKQGLSFTLTSDIDFNSDDDVFKDDVVYEDDKMQENDVSNAKHYLGVQQIPCDQCL
ncbi:12311_t:CDS:2, partial [Racocetra fulgida]